MRQNVKSISTKYYNATHHYHQMNDWKDVELKSHLTECEHLSSVPNTHTHIYRSSWILANYSEMNNAKMMNLKLSITIESRTQWTNWGGRNPTIGTCNPLYVFFIHWLEEAYTKCASFLIDYVCPFSYSSFFLPLSLPSFNKKNIFMINHHHPFLFFCDFFFHCFYILLL